MSTLGLPVEGTVVLSEDVSVSVVVSESVGVFVGVNLSVVVVSESEGVFVGVNLSVVVVSESKGVFVGVDLSVVVAVFNVFLYFRLSSHYSNNLQIFYCDNAILQHFRSLVLQYSSVFKPQTS